MGERSLLQRLTVVFLVVVCAASALGQESVLDRDRDPALDGTKRVLADLSYASLRYGSVYLLYRFELSDIALDPGLVPSRSEDLKLSVGASLPTRAYWVPSRKFAISGDVTPTYGFVDRDGLEGQGGYGLRGDAHLMLNHLYFNPYVAKADQFGPLPVELGGIGTVRRTTTGADAELKYSSKTSLLMTAAHARNEYPASRLQPRDVDPTLYDYDEDRYRATFLHRTLPRIALSLSAEGGDYDLPHSGYRTAVRRYLGAGATWTAGRRSLRVEAGPARLQFGGSGFHNFSGLVGTVRATAPVGRRWTIQGNARRDAQFSNYADNAYFTMDEIGADFGFVSTRRLSLHVTPVAGWNQYDTPVNGIRRRDDYQSVLAGWTYAMSKLRGGFDIGYYQRDSNVLAENASGIRVILRLSFTGNKWFK